jgi:sugar O-acyltransferase (sialic acid O-acetyltransferase NeuD family)
MNILLLGASGHARVIIDIVERAARHRIVGLLTEDLSVDATCSGYPILGCLDDLVARTAEYRVEGIIAAVGDNWSRSDVLRRVNNTIPELSAVPAVHPSAELGKCVSVGDGTVIMAGVVINSGTRIGQHCIVNTRASIDHDCVIEDFASVAPGATLGGNVRVGRFAAVSLGANVIHGVTIGEHTVVGAGSVVLSDLPSHVVAYGVPARIVRQRSEGQRYL